MTTFMRNDKPLIRLVFEEAVVDGHKIFPNRSPGRGAAAGAAKFHGGTLSPLSYFSGRSVQSICDSAQILTRARPFAKFAFESIFQSGLGASQIRSIIYRISQTAKCDRCFGKSLSGTIGRLMHRIAAAVAFTLQHTCRISSINRIVCDVRIEIDLIVISDRIGLEEPPETR